MPARIHGGSPCFDADRKKAADISHGGREGAQTGHSALQYLPDITLEDSYANLDRSGETQDRCRRQADWPQGGSHLQGDAAVVPDRRAGLWLPPRHHDDRDGAKVRTRIFCLPRVEVELAFVLGKRLLARVLASPMCCGRPNTSSRRSKSSMPGFQDPRKIVDTVADNGAAAGIVVGGPAGRADGGRPALGRRHHVRNSEIEETGVAAGVLGLIRRSASPGLPTSSAHTG